MTEIWDSASKKQTNKQGISNSFHCCVIEQFNASKNAKGHLDCLKLGLCAEVVEMCHDYVDGLFQEI
jgi:hypothetical protein